MKQLILMSGGLESAAVAALAASRGHRTTALFVDYGQRALAKEDRAAEALCAHYGIYLMKVAMQIPFWADSMLVDPEWNLVKANEAATGARRSHIVAFRNLIVLGMAASFADKISDGGDVEILTGFDWRNDNPGAARDKSPRFVEAVNQAMSAANERARAILVKAPFQGNSKGMTIIQATDVDRHLPWDLSWSCYNDFRLHCGVCAACADRQDGFAGSETKDPTAYLPEDERPEV